jgi:O-antigen ligase
MAGIAIALNTHVFRAPLQVWITGRLENTGFEFYSALFLVPALGIPLIRLFARAMVSKPVRGSMNPWNLQDTGILGLTTVLLLGTVYAPDIERALIITGEFIALCLPYYFLGRYFLLYETQPVTQAHTFMKWTWMLAILAGLVSLLSIVPVNVEEQTGRLTTLGSNPLPFALLMGTALLINVYWLLRKPSSSSTFKLLIWVTPFILIYFLIAANSRGPLFGFLLCAGVLICGLFWQQRRTVLLFRSFLAFVLMAGACAATWLTFPEVIENFGERMELTGDENDTVRLRLESLRVAADLFEDAPLVGVGTGGVRFYHTDFTHNLIMEVAAEHGIVGLLALGCFVGGAIFHLIIAIFRTRNSLALFFSVCALYILFWSMVSGSLAGLKQLYFFVGIQTLFVSYARHSERRVSQTIPGNIKTKIPGPSADFDCRGYADR